MNWNRILQPSFNIKVLSTIIKNGGQATAVANDTTAQSGDSKD
jgi:hypothetical protein